MVNHKNLRPKIDALKQEHAALPDLVGWQSTAHLNAKLAAYIQALEVLPTTVSDVDICGDPQLIMSIPYPLSRPILTPGWQQIDMGLYYREGAGKDWVVLGGVLLQVASAIGEIVTGSIGNVMRFFNDPRGLYYTHWLGGSGTPLAVPVHKILSDVSDFQAKVQTEFINMVSKVNNSIAQNIQDFPNRDCHSFLIHPESSTDWRSQETTATIWQDAFGQFQFCLGANVLAKRQSDGSWDVQMCYSVFIYDIYDWNGDRSDPDFLLGPMELVQAAKQFEIKGATQPVCIKYAYPNISYPSFQMPTASSELPPE